MKKLCLSLLFLSSLCSAQCVIPQHDSTLIFTADTSANCAGYWLIPASEYTAYLSSVEMTVADTTAAFMWGFGTVVLFSAIAFKINVVRKLVGMA